MICAVEGKGAHMDLPILPTDLLTHAVKNRLAAERSVAPSFIVSLSEGLRHRRQVESAIQIEGLPLSAIKLLSLAPHEVQALLEKHPELNCTIEQSEQRLGTL